jgi:hypothetical protein
VARVQYIEKSFQRTGQYIIYWAERICAENAAQGYSMTLRQLYYQFVAQDLFPDDWTFTWTGTRWVKDPNGTKNATPNYDKLGVILNEARLAGYLDWDYLVDRTRNLEQNPHWSGPQPLLRAAAKQFMVDRWADQDYYLEAWIEKDALVGVLEDACPDLDVPFFSCRGYTSQSEMWSAAQRIGEKINEGKRVRIIHLGDHDPSGVDMSRDIHERISLFVAQDLGLEGPKGRQDDIGWYTGALTDSFEVDRIALNMDQVRQYNPPPNPAKLTDSRAGDYVARYGYESWELDALSVADLVQLVKDAVDGYVDEDRMEEQVEREDEIKGVLSQVAGRYQDVAKFLAETDPTKKLIEPEPDEEPEDDE